MFFFKNSIKADLSTSKNFIFNALINWILQTLKINKRALTQIDTQSRKPLPKHTNRTWQGIFYSPTTNWNTNAKYKYRQIVKPQINIYNNDNNIQVLYPKVSVIWDRLFNRVFSVISFIFSFNFFLKEVPV